MKIKWWQYPLAVVQWVVLTLAEKRYRVMIIGGGMSEELIRDDLEFVYFRFKVSQYEPDLDRAVSFLEKPGLRRLPDIVFLDIRFGNYQEIDVDSLLEVVRDIESKKVSVVLLRWENDGRYDDCLVLTGSYDEIQLKNVLFDAA